MTLQLNLDPPSGPLHRTQAAPVTVTLTNNGSEPVVVNRRLSPGYADSFPRELYFDVDADYGRLKYDRDISTGADYGPLDAGASISARVDLLRWYRITEPGRYRVTAHYQGDEPGSRPPVGVAPGVVSSGTVEITVR